MGDNGSGDRAGVIPTDAIPLLNGTNTKQLASWSTLQAAKAMVLFHMAVRLNMKFIR